MLHAFSPSTFVQWQADLSGRHCPVYSEFQRSQVSTVHTRPRVLQEIKRQETITCCL